MINSTKYSFSRAGSGSLDLELDEASKQVYRSSLPDAIPFKIEGLDIISDEEVKSIHFFEWQNIQYTYVIEEENQFKAPFELKINERTIKKSISKSNVHLLNGQFAFNDEVGETKIQVRDSENKLVFSLQTEVFPQKMDYKSDYKAMMAEISEIIQNLAFDSLKDTFKTSRPRLSGHTTEHEWWNILDALFDQLIVNLGVIKRQPKHEIKTYEKVLPVEKIRQASKRNVDWLRKNAHFSNRIGVGLKVGEDYYTHALSSKKHVTYDTFENRFVAWAVKNIIEQLRKYHQHTNLIKGNKDYSRLLQKMKDYQSRLQGILHENPFNEVSEFEKRSHFSTSLTRGAGYRDFMHVYLLLTRGLEITDNDIFKIEQKNVSTLYEYWCFLMLVKLLKEQNKSLIDFQDLIKIRSGKFKVELVKGKSSKVRFKKIDSTETTTVYFNREFVKGTGKIYTYNQKPDYSIEFNKDGFKKPFWYLFDAKYRFEEYKNDDESIKNTYNVPQDAIGQLHRYRDAILHTEPTNSTYRGAIKNLGGIILYPYPLPETQFKTENIFYKSITEVNIGAMPFLPSKTNLVNDFLGALINKSPNEHFEQFIEMDRSEYNENRNLWKEWVTINVIPKENQKERIKFMQDKLICHIPFVKNSNSKLFMTKNLLACKAGTTEAYLYDVTSWEIMNDKELELKGTNWNHKKNKYIVFHLTNEKQIITPDNITPMSFRYATSEGLRKYLKNSTKDKNSFYLTSPDAARLYEELTYKNIKFDINWSKNEMDPSLVEFTVDDKIILSSDSYLSIHYKIGNELIHLNKLLQKLF